MSIFQVFETVDVPRKDGGDNQSISVDTSEQGQGNGSEGGDLSWRRLFIQISQKMTSLGAGKEERQWPISSEGGESVQDVRGVRLERKLHQRPQAVLKRFLSLQAPRRRLISARSTCAALRRTQESVAMLRQIVGLILTELKR